jgi:hypothetical protein
MISARPSAASMGRLASWTRGKAVKNQREGRARIRLKKMLTKERFRRMDEATLCAEVITPLLIKLGYNDVNQYHGGAGEQGKDIVCWKNDELGGRINLAIVAKATRMNGKAKANTGTAGEVQTQIRQCFNSSYRDPVTGTEQKVGLVWVMNNHEIGKESITAISSALGDPELRTVRFVSGDALWQQVEKHLPVTVLAHAQELQRQIDAADPHFKPRITVGDDRVSIAIEERYPGAAEQNPLKFTGRLVFPTKADKKKFDRAMQHYVETGEAFDVPAEYVGGIDFPESMQTLLGVESLKPQAVRIGPVVTPKELQVRLTIRCDAGETYVCDFIRMAVVRAGTKEIALAGNQKDAPFDIEIIIRHHDGQGNIATTPWNTPYNAVQWLNFLNMRTCLSKPATVEIFALDLGVKVLSMNSPGNDEAPSADYVNLIEKLAALQRKFTKPLYLPADGLTDEDARTIEELYDAVTTGYSQSEWQPFKQTIQPTREHLDAIIETFGNNRTGLVTAVVNRVVELLGEKMPVGRVRCTAHNARIKDFEGLQKRYEELLTMENFEVEFVPADSAILVREYELWLPEEEKIKLRYELDDEQSTQEIATIEGWTDSPF